MKQPTPVFAILLLVAGLQSAVSRNIVPPTGDNGVGKAAAANMQDHNGTIGSNVISESSTIPRKVNLVAPETNGKNINKAILSEMDSLENGKSQSLPTYPKDKFSTKSAASDRANLVSLSKGNKERDYIGFPPYRGSNAERYQRQRRSYHTSPMTHMEPELRPSYSNYAQPDELEFNLNNNDDREAFLQLLAILRSKDLLNSNLPLVKNDDEEFEDEEEPAIDLGYFGKQPLAYDSSKRPSEPISLMSSSPGLTMPFRNKPTNGFLDGSAFPSSYSFHDGSLSLRDGDDSTDDEGWLEDAIPLHSHAKTRRAGNPVAMSMGYSSSPIKSHFRMLRSLRKPGGIGAGKFLTNYDSGYFGSFYPVPARRLMQKRQALYM